MTEQPHYIDYGAYKAHSFHCMGGLCEVLVEATNTEVSTRIFHVAMIEAQRIEKKLSRYRDDNIIHKLNSAGGRAVWVDKETEQILKYADQLYHVSGGLFDVTSGVLRKIWRFQGQECAIDQGELTRVMKFVGWSRVQRQGRRLRMPSGFELDLGGIGKEYAVDRCVLAIKQLDLAPALVNFGGDISVTGPKKSGEPWKVKVDQMDKEVFLHSGAVATSGDKNRFVFYKGQRLGHILNPKTGWPVDGAPKSVTVVGENCTQAGSLSTLAILQGPEAERFLSREADTYFVNW